MVYDPKCDIPLTLTLVTKPDLEARAKQEGRSRNNLINVALEKYLRDGNKTLLSSKKKK